MVKCNNRSSTGDHTFSSTVSAQALAVLLQIEGSCQKIMTENNKKRAFKFKLSSTDSGEIPNAEVLFRDIKNRDPRIQHLWSHQADILRAYHEKISHRDIALELPTGTGKTLVGLLIAEWRKRVLGERVVYLCPTRQLAYQVGARANEYGITSYVFVGSQNQYNPSHFSSYRSANAIAITTYSGVFNTNPRLEDPETIILDDAHAGENYIASMWSLSISRFEHKDLYRQVVELFAKDMPNYLIPELYDDTSSIFQRGSLDLLPGPKLIQKLSELTSLLDGFSNIENKLIYPWQLIRSQLHSCNVFFSWGEILIRPMMPPSLMHEPFSNAKQRIYMSATLGAAGELERITGIPHIHRIPAPAGWDKQSTGRRLFVFPNRSFTDDEFQPWLARLVESMDRVLVLTPHSYSLRSFISEITDAGIEHEILGSQDVETSLESFTSNPRAILALTNRYDGIDLPGDACRVMIVYGLPTSVNLLERFLWSKLGASAVLRDRIRTRITQAVGRCTRGSTDYALLIMVGDDLLEFCIKRENRSELHPELRAEIEFGLDNSDMEDVDNLTSLTDLFLSRSAAWSEAEEDIAKRRDDTAISIQPYTEPLRNAVNLEVEYQYDLWRGDFSAALEKATRIIDTLSGDELSGYRALWNYFAGCTAYYLSSITSDDKMIKIAADRFYRASQASRGITWFAKLAQEIEPRKELEANGSILSTLSINFLNDYLTKLGTVGRKFEKLIGEYRSNILEDDAARFDKGLTELGKMLGFDSEKPDGPGVPDSAWKLGSDLTLLFECKSDEKTEDGISIRTCRQAQGHQEWHKAHPFFDQHAEVITIVVSPRKYLSSDAAPHANGLFYMNIEDIRNLFAEAEACLRSIRSKSVDLEKEQRFQVIQSELSYAGLLPENVIEKLRKVQLITLKKK